MVDAPTCPDCGSIAVKAPQGAGYKCSNCGFAAASLPGWPAPPPPPPQPVQEGLAPHFQLTRHFSVSEFDQAARHGQPATPYPWEWIRERLYPLCLQLEVLRAALGDGGGRSIRIISGYRSPAYNKAVGGKRNSQHLHGRAADIKVHNLGAAEVHKVCLGLYEMGKLKLGGLGLYPGFVHLDMREGKRLARWTGGRTAT